jgi:hypothetical protein
MKTNNGKSTKEKTTSKDANKGILQGLIVVTLSNPSNEKVQAVAGFNENNGFQPWEVVGSVRLNSPF